MKEIRQWFIPYRLEANFSGLPGICLARHFMHVWQPQIVSTLTDLSSMVGVMEDQAPGLLYICIFKLKTSRKEFPIMFAPSHKAVVHPFLFPLPVRGRLRDI